MLSLYHYIIRSNISNNKGLLNRSQIKTISLTFIQIKRKIINLHLYGDFVA